MRRTLIVCTIAFALTAVFFIDFCNLVYRCGCTSLWAGADAKCNIHDHAAKKHCPWCSHGETGYGVIFASVLWPQWMVAYLARRRPWKTHLLATVLSFPLAGGLVALAVGLMDGYWTS